jgi:hypothetical protein
MLIIEEVSVTVKCRTAIKTIVFYFNVCKGESSLMFVYIYILLYEQTTQKNDEKGSVYIVCLLCYYGDNSYFIYFHIESYCKHLTRKLLK